jgi:Icc protein
MKIIHITDTHLVRPGETIYGLDPAERLETVVTDVIARHGDADLVVITGDLADRGEPEAYARLDEILSPLPMPIRLLLGNHDSREAFRDRFTGHPVDENGFVQSYLDAPDGLGRLIFIDTHEPGWSGGRVCDQRLDWLTLRLDEASDRPAYIFMHHPPFDMGVRHFEKIGLEQPERFVATLDAHPGKVRHLFLGHVHLPVNGVLASGIPFTAGRGCNHQMALDFNAMDCIWAAHEPNYSVIMLEPHGLFVHAFDLIGAPQIATGAYPPGP